MAKPQVYFTVPGWDLLKFPPDPLPATLPAPIADGTFRSPFEISPDIFNAVLHPAVPITFAAIYVFTILNVNAYNRSRNYKPWAISQTRAFYWFVIVHNLALAAYSFATFLALGRAAFVSVPERDDPTGAAGLVDSLCKLHGPRVLGDAITFNSTINIWESKNQAIKLLPTGLPNGLDSGRIWSEGLAFWGWWFYISKFYEVVDTLTIVAKGKRSPTLQTYHHAGAMLCMWAGIRYMSPPIWMFVFVNSFIHSLMYVYYALTTMKFRVPEAIKRTLTTMQMAQILWGATYAGAHLFIAYDIPVATPYKVAAKVAAVASSVSSAVSSVSSVVSSAIESPTVSGSLGLFVKKLLLRAAGEEGAAERLAIPAVTNKPVAEVIESKIEAARERVFHQPVYETKWHNSITRVNCIDTSGEAFAIWLNLLYLFPLLALFVRFFIKSYLTRGKPRTVKEAVSEIKEDAKIAEAKTEEAVEKAGKRAEDAVRNGSAELRKEVKSLHDQLRDDVRKLKKGEYNAPNLKERINKFDSQVKSLTDKAKQQVQGATDSSSAKKDEDNESEEEADDKENQTPGQSPQTPDKKKKKKKKNKHALSTTSTPGNAPAADESSAKQDSNLSATKPTRPGTADADDTDAMGKSGVGIDLSKSVAESTSS